MLSDSDRFSQEPVVCPIPVIANNYHNTRSKLEKKTIRTKFSAKQRTVHLSNRTRQNPKESPNFNFNFQQFNLDLFFSPPPRCSHLALAVIISPLPPSLSLHSVSLCLTLSTFTFVPGAAVLSFLFSLFFNF